MPSRRFVPPVARPVPAMSTRRAQRGRPQPLQEALPPPPDAPDGSRQFFVSQRKWSLHFATLVCMLPLPMTPWLLSLTSLDSWRDNPFGPALWWLIPLLLIGLSAVLPLMMLLVHDRYVLRLDRTATGTWRLTTFVLWGSRMRELPASALPATAVGQEEGQFNSLWTPSVNAPYIWARLATGKRLIFDLQGEAPFGWDALRRMLGARQIAD